MKKKLEAKATKNTFWNNLRIKNGMTYKDLSETMNKSVGNLGNWFSGRCMPCDSDITDLCDLFGVDFEVGKAEFAKANDAWSSSRNASKEVEYVPVPGSISATAEEEITFEEDEPEAATKPSAMSWSTRDDILRHFYGKVEYEEYSQLQAALDGKGDPLAMLYGKISFDDFIAISQKFSV